ncbi:polysaccharide deacetylase family protein [Rubeoparvulum massiliense]|uniref:hypothetical protein n=1 Tax=Rubeoparvulum massiliense TaxID=1631346 RepID=UPI00065E19E5|nr:hypothetical protein [Rubeoparvulum massiliense]
MNTHFTKQHYCEILEELQRLNFPFLIYDELDQDSLWEQERQVILRHDIDLSISYAHQMAELEEKLNIRSTYFVWLTSPFYNVLSSASRTLLKEIKGMGHQLGLHFDASPFQESNELVDQIIHESKILSQIIDSPVQIYSFHRPSNTLLNQQIQIPGYLNAYDQRFFTEYKYLSDSNHHWREGCACQHLHHEKKLNLLIHPIWWISKESISPQIKLELYQRDVVKYTKEELANNIQGYQNILTKLNWLG